MRTIYEAEDRQGLKYFAGKPEFLALHDIWTGKRVARPKGRCRIVRRFTAKVQNSGVSILMKYPKTIRVKPRIEMEQHEHNDKKTKNAKRR